MKIFFYIIPFTLGLLLSRAAALDFSSSDLPIVVIDTHGQSIPYDDPRIVADMGIIYNGPGQRNNLSDAFNNYNGKISIEIRGQSSAGWDKKSYSMETQNDDGSNRNVSLIDLPEENDWILYAPYYDRSLMRNILTFHLMREMGWYASRTRYCELVLNGEYRGLYVLMEKIKRDKNRVDIAKLNPDEVSGDDLTGGYILRVDKEPWKPGFDSPYEPFPQARTGIRYQYRYPKADDIVEQQQIYIKTFVLSFENMMHDSMYADPLNGYAKYLNVASFIDYVLINELSRNVDAYRLSAYFYKDKDSDGGKLTAGPVWDYNFSFGNVDYYDTWKTEGWQLVYFADDDYFHQVDNFFMPFWWKLLFTEKGFAQKLKNRWQELRRGLLSKEAVNEDIDGFAEITTEARARNFEIWPGPGETNLGGGWFPGDPRSSEIDSYEDEIRLLKNWIYDRMGWMDKNIPLLTSLDRNGRKPNAQSFKLYQNYPNPFNNKTIIHYELPVSNKVELSIYNLLGQKVATLTSGMQAAGEYKVHWDAAHFPGGIYIFRFRAGSAYAESRKLILLK